MCMSHKDGRLGLYSRQNSVEVGLQFQEDERCKGAAEMPGLKTLGGRKIGVRILLIIPDVRKTVTERFEILKKEKGREKKYT